MKRGISGLTKWGYLFLVLVIVSCNKDKRTEFFELNHFVDFDIQPGLNTFDTHFFVVSPLTSIYHDKLAAAGRMHEEVVAIEAKDAVLSSTFGDVNLEFIHRISVHIFDPYNPSDKIEFFYLDPTPFKNSTNWRLFPGIADISEWVDRDYFGIEVRLNFRENSPSFTPMRLEFDIRVLGN